MKVKYILKINAVPVFVASLCCLSPVILILFGIGTVGFASSLGDVLYGQYKWYFRAAGLIVMAIAFIIYFRRTKGICTVDSAIEVPE